jgi:hypothetical protein
MLQAVVQEELVKPKEILILCIMFALFIVSICRYEYNLTSCQLHG